MGLILKLPRLQTERNVFCQTDRQTRLPGPFRKLRIRNPVMTNRTFILTVLSLGKAAYILCITTSLKSSLSAQLARQEIELRERNGCKAICQEWFLGQSGKAQQNNFFLPHKIPSRQRVSLIEQKVFIR